ncbi:MAG: hypothetical protein HOP23_05040 [Methylococcaceae bacterium]|nr:hypothetical protein [Methylococcaceae bacterium]
MNAEVILSKASHKFVFILLLPLISGCLLQGCEKNNPGGLQPPSVSTVYDKETFLEGVVSDNKGPVKSGNIRVTNDANQMIASTAIHDRGQYNIAIPAYTHLPIVLTYSPDFRNAAAEKLITAIVYPNITKYDINPRTTAIAKNAQAMGGYTPGNMIIAAEGAASVPDTNKTTAGFRGDTTKQYGGWH